MKIIGKVSAAANSPSSADDFTFWLRDDIVIAPFDIIAVENYDRSTTVGVIREINHVTDSPSHIANYVSSDFGVVDQDATTPRLGTTYATVEVVSNDKEVYMPLRDGAAVRFAEPEEIRQALGIDGIVPERRIPAGFLRLSNAVTVPVFLDSSFLIGPEGAHLNISGISGLATKTSYAMFLLQAVSQGAESGRTAIIIFNVKGDDLLYVDRPADHTDDANTQAWQNCGLRGIPFSDVRYFFPYARDARKLYANTWCDVETLRTLQNNGNAENYIYTYEHDRDKLDLLMSNIDDPNFTLDAIRNEILTSSRFEKLSDWDGLERELLLRCEAGRGEQIPVVSWRRFKRLVSTIVSGESAGIFQDTRSGAKEKLHTHLSDEIAKIRPGQTYVIDIAQIPEQQKCLVFGDVLRSTYKLKTEGDPAGPERIIIFVDELNKYAPEAVKNSPIIGDLLEITERGRSLGIVLFSAEQFRSEVHPRVKGNCGTNVYGRTNAVEVASADYRCLPKTFTNMMTRLQKGQLIIQHPIFRSLLKVVFPRPAYFQKVR
jgi:DNA helicase HerA-like ATPase